MSERRWYHGGIRDLQEGDYLLPPSETGNSTLLQYAKSIPGATQRADRVYLTTDPGDAAFFASVLPHGDVYEAVPEGAVEPDTDCTVPGLSVQCDRARIVAVVKRRVPLPRRPVVRKRR